MYNNRVKQRNILKFILKWEKPMQGYKTEQKTILLDYLSAHADRAFTLEELCASMVGRGVGKSTVYRLVARLAEEGVVRRYLREGRRGYTYQFFAGQDCHAHLHLRCTACGRVLHLCEGASDALRALLSADCGFALDGEKTMLYGSCAACAASTGKEAGV